MICDYNVGETQFPKIILKRAESIIYEILAGREHFRNYREFMANNGLYPYIDRCGFVIEVEKTVDAGETVFCLLRKG